MEIRYCPAEEGAIFEGWDIVIDNKCPNCGNQLTDIPAATQTIIVD